MLRHNSYLIELTTAERRELEARASKYSSLYRDVLPAKIALLAAQGLPNDVFAARLDSQRQIISKWRKRFFYANASRASRKNPEADAQPAFPYNIVGLKAHRLRTPHQRERDAGTLVVARPAPRSAGTPASHPHGQRHDALAVAGRGCDSPLVPSELAVPPTIPLFAKRPGPVLDLYAHMWNGPPAGT